MDKNSITVSRDEYVKDPMRFPCVWEDEITFPAWMHDFEEKMAAFRTPCGRLMSTTHRADWIHYPENSIESVISAIKMGVDNIELDARKTRDGVVVLLHDTTLERLTDWSDKAGKNGLPTSNRLIDWSYEELKELRLRKNSDLFKTDGEMTPYIIPTFEEVLTVCRDRVTMRLDKLDAWDWDADIYPLIRKTESWRTIIPNIEFGAQRQKEIYDTIKADSGKEVPVWYSCGDPSAVATLAEEMGRRHGYPVFMRVGIDQPHMHTFVESLEPCLATLRGKARICTDMFTVAGGTENVETWEYLYGKGFGLILVDHGLPLQRYIAEHFAPTPY